MDSKLRILLKKYLASHDPDDAVAFTENFIRANAEEALDDIFVWRLESKIPDNVLNVDIYLIYKTAVDAACDEILEAINEEEIDMEHALPLWMVEFRELCEVEQREQAWKLYEKRLKTGHGPFIPSYFPEIHIYQEKLD